MRAQTGRSSLIVLGLDHDRAALVEARQLAVVGQAQMLGPAQPVVVALIGQGGAVQGRIVDPDHRGRGAGRAVAGRRQGIEIEGAQAPARELQPDRGADHAGADDHRVVALRHAKPPRVSTATTAGSLGRNRPPFSDLDQVPLELHADGHNAAEGSIQAVLA